MGNRLELSPTGITKMSVKLGYSREFTLHIDDDQVEVSADWLEAGARHELAELLREAADHIDPEEA